LDRSVVVRPGGAVEKIDVDRLAELDRPLASGIDGGQDLFDVPTRLLTYVSTAALRRAEWITCLGLAVLGLGLGSKRRVA